MLFVWFPLILVLIIHVMFYIVSLFSTDALTYQRNIPSKKFNSFLPTGWCNCYLDVSYINIHVGKKFRPSAHLCAVTCITEISLNVMLSNQSPPLTIINLCTLHRWTSKVVNITSQCLHSTNLWFKKKVAKILFLDISYYHMILSVLLCDQDIVLSYNRNVMLMVNNKPIFFYSVLDFTVHYFICNMGIIQICIYIGIYTVELCIIDNSLYSSVDLLRYSL